VPAPASCNNDGTKFCRELLTKVGVVTTPGAAFGSEGQNHIRIALVQPLERLQEAMNRICEFYS
ncbi:MAG: hypothetical protein SFU25_10235, partial [Candidatus Caenarcaniphilales bacterium]|nr:hypothetical protein [Candidatus Caenarcaniphilales bacterium]